MNESQTQSKQGSKSETATTESAVARNAHVAGSDEIKIALVGCGGRGSGAAANALNTSHIANVKLVAMADAFPERLQTSLRARSGSA